MDWSRFDHIAVADFLPYEKTRGRKLQTCFERVGITHAEHYWDYETPFTTAYMKSFRLNKCCTKLGTFACTMNHYRILKTALGKGFDHILVFEDDARFLLDLEKLDLVVRNLPEDYDFAKFEWYPSKSWREGMKTKIAGTTDSWMSANEFSTNGGCCCAYSRRGMAWKVREIEKARDRRAELRSIDCYDGFGFLPKDVRTYVATVPAVIQGIPPGGRVNASHKKYLMPVETESVWRAWYDAD